MKITNKFKYVRLLSQLQGKNANGRNRITFNLLLLAGWPPADARRAMIRLNRIKLVDIIRGHRVTSPSIQKTLLGERRHPIAMKITADSVDIPIHEFYPEECHEPAHT